jgi:SAM-dependent methyltransferase
MENASDMVNDGSQKSYLYKDLPKTCAPDDFWGQVKRTVNGKPVGEDQIQLIVDAILDGLQIGATDTLLDLCCGNGALTDRIFARCQGGLGVDFSEPLIAVAGQHFQRAPQRIYRLDDVEAFLRSADDTARFTKALCYGAFQYLPKEKAENVLMLLHRRFPQVQHFFIGNLPDRAKIDEFFGDRPREPGVEKDPEAPIGIWRDETEFAALSHGCGWHVEFRRMPAQFYAAHYRYDAVLTRATRGASRPSNA